MRVCFPPELLATQGQTQLSGGKTAQGKPDCCHATAVMLFQTRFFLPDLTEYAMQLQCIQIDTFKTLTTTN